MYSNADVTIYNKYIDRRTRTDAYKRTVIKNVFFDEKKATNRLQSGLKDADQVLLLVPFNHDSPAEYALPVEFRELEDKSKNFTLQNGDRIVKGDIDYEVTGKIADLDKSYQTFTITSVDAKDFGSKKMRHFEVGAG